MTEQIKRINEMEQCLDKALEAVSAMEDALLKYSAAMPCIERLSNYYGSPLWREDFEADCEGKIPHDLRRGVLSEDGVYNMLCDNRQILDELMKILNTYCDNGD